MLLDHLAVSAAKVGLANDLRLHNVYQVIIASVSAVAGAVIASIIWRMWSDVQRDKDARAMLEKMPSVAPELLAIVPLISQPAVVIGPHDEVLKFTDAAQAIGMVRGSRISIPEVLEMVRQGRKSKHSITQRMAVRRPYGVQASDLEVSVARLGENGAMLVLAQDLTPTQRIDESRRDFVANISHELKTPIGAIRALAEAVQAGADDPEAVAHFTGMMQKETARLSELVGQIIDLSRLQADNPLLDAHPVDLADVVGEAVGRYQTIARSRDVNLVVTGEGSWVVGDHGQLVDAVSNLVSNAINYSEPGARVAVSVGNREIDGEEWVELAVADNGIGIKPEDQERVFDRFFRVDYGRSRQSGGTGLGLSIVSLVAQAHGGNVHLWSQPGQGSTFTLRLPIAPQTREDLS